MIREIVQIFRNYDADCEVLVASIRHPLHVIEAAKLDRKSTRLNSSHIQKSRMPSSA